MSTRVNLCQDSGPNYIIILLHNFRFPSHFL